MATSYTQRTLKHLREEGWEVCIVERYIQIPGSKHGKKLDAFGFGDLLAYDDNPNNPRIVMVQSTGKTGHAAHRRTILGEPRALGWLHAEGLILLISWRKLKKKNKDGSWSKKGYWTPRIEWITEDMFDGDGDG